ncbi:transposase [Pseudomonas sp. SDO528_S397]
MRTGCPSRDLPEAFGGWSKVYKHFNAWPASGKWLEVFQVLVIDADMKWVSSVAATSKPTSTVQGLPAARIRQSGKVEQATPVRFTWL